MVVVLWWCRFNGGVGFGGCLVSGSWGLMVVTFRGGLFSGVVGLMVVSW